MNYRGDRKQAGRTKKENAAARRTAEGEAEEIARQRLKPFPVDLKAAMDDLLFGDFPSTAKMLRLFTAYPAFVKRQVARDPGEYAMGDREGRGGFLTEASIRECRGILDRFRKRLTQEQLRAFEGVLSLWEEGYADEDFRRRLLGEKDP